MPSPIQPGIGGLQPGGKLIGKDASKEENGEGDGEGATKEKDGERSTDIEGVASNPGSHNSKSSNTNSSSITALHCSTNLSHVASE
mmetsp:Transcript_3842/g.5831  ORF Transcript_3842/g.5831 Transcript_3842/m.5831 type:complete len:86 (+) Transcript_3842:253-510(+)